MDMQGKFSLNKPGFFKRLGSRMGKQTPELELTRASWELKDESIAKIEDSLSEGSFEDKVSNFSHTLSELKSKEGKRPLYAASVLGMRHLNALSENSLIEVTAGANSAAEHCVKSAMGSYLGQLTDATQVGLKAYQENPQGDPFELAGDLEDQVGWLAEDMSPALEKVHPEVAPHIELYESIASDAEFYSGDTIRALGKNPDRPLAQTLKEAIEMPRHYGDNETMDDIHRNVLSRLEVSFDENEDIRGLVERSYDAVENDWSREALMKALDLDKIKTRSQKQS